MNAKTKRKSKTPPQPPIVHTYQITDSGKLTTMHFELYELFNSGNALLSDKIKLSLDRDCAKSKPEYWLQERIKVNNIEKWGHYITGLFPFKTGLYTGDLEKKKHLLVFHISPDKTKMRIYYFENYHTYKISDIGHYIGANYIKTIPDDKRHTIKENTEILF